jgi:aspartate kinase
MVVQKFGGTSVADPEAIRRLIEIVRTTRARDGRGPAVVVSAMSGVTDALLAIATAAGDGRQDEALSRIEQLRTRHVTTAHTLAPATAPALEPILNGQFDQLVAIVNALAVLREASPRTLDVVAAVGELLSSRIVAAALESEGVPSAWVDARRVVITNDEHTRATPLMRETSAALRATLLPLVDEGRVPVLGGFVGATLQGHTTTLAR